MRLDLGHAYWTSTTDQVVAAWNTYFLQGSTASTGKWNGLFARAVRDLP
jgi:hypothetical protein